MLSRHYTLSGLAAALAVVTAVCVVDSLAWIDRPFMGFVLGRNRIVAPLGLSHWTGLTADVPFGSQLVTADGRDVESVARLVERVWKTPVGTPIRYGFVTPAGHVERVVPVMRFTLWDYLSFFGLWLVSGAVFFALGFVVAYLKPGRAASTAMLIFAVAWGLTLILSLGDFYRFHFRSLYALAQATLPAALIGLGITLPDRPLPRRRGLLLAGLAAATALHAGLDVTLYDRAPVTWMSFFEASVVYLAAAALLACLLLVRWYRRTDTDGRTRLKVVALSATFAFGFPAVVHLTARASGVWVPVNMLPVATLLFPVGVAYAILKRDLLDLDPLLTRGVFYGLFMATITVAYVGALGLASRLGSAPHGASAWLPFLFTLAAFALTVPLRGAVRRLVDRVFFRVDYDPERVLEVGSRRLLGARDPAEVARELRRTLSQTLAPAPCLVLLPGPPGVLVDDASGLELSRADAPIDARAGGGADVLPVRALPHRGPPHLDAHGVTLVVPLRGDRRLEGVLALGPKQSGLPYGTRDLALLRTLGNHATVALENAASYAAVRELTATLEERVASRTRDLESTHDTLLATQGALARADKLASLGRLVAGVAHEINNPVAFINSSVDLIHTAAVHVREQLDGNADPATTATLDQLIENAAICRDGALRASHIVTGLSAFARQSKGRWEATDLHAALERTLQLLGSQHRDRVEIVRDFGDIPTPVCNPGEIDQVFMNLLANAFQAIDGSGRVTLRTRHDGAAVVIEVSDTGPGIPDDVRERIFEPFFSTKDGGGTGLGLAIAHSLVARHGGDLTVDTTPGGGSTFVVRLPITTSEAPE
jgi:signal transduction histidine kinase